MIVPARLTFYVLLIVAAGLFFAGVWPPVLGLAVAADIAVGLFCLLQGLMLRRCVVRGGFSVSKQLCVGESSALSFAVRNTGSRDLTATLEFRWPRELESKVNTVTLNLPRGVESIVRLDVIPNQRGPVRVEAVEATLRFGLPWVARRVALSACELVVYPSLKPVGKYDTLRRHRALQRAGVHRMRLVGAGREFEKLREYQPDDQYRDINWKGSARRGKLITGVFQAERSQDLIICVDCGRMMNVPLDNGTVLDRAVDAAVLLAHVGAQQMDRVGLVLFSDTVQVVQAPTSGRRTVTRVTDALARVSGRNVFTSYGALAETLRGKLKKRAMVFILTDLNDPQLAANMVEALATVSRRHVVTVVSLKDAALERLAEGVPRNRDGLFQVLAARALLDERRTWARRLEEKNARILQADADALSIELINRYLELKTRQSL